MKLKSIHKISLECAMGNFSGLMRDSPELSAVGPFDQYFATNEFNCVLVEKATKGNSLFFSVMYLVYKLDWKTLLPKFSD